MQDIYDCTVQYIIENQNKFYRLAYSYVKEEQAALDVIQNAICRALEGCFGLKFEQTTDRMSMSDYRFWEKIEQLMRECYPEQAEPLLADEDAKEAFEEELEEYLDEQDEQDETPDWMPDAFGHKIGGYPGFSQEDPRDIAAEDDHDVLLLQIDTDDIGEREIMWGDSGVANFFISREHLKQRNFQDVIYTWDCC